MKLCKPAVVVEVTRQLGYPESDIVGIGVLLLTCTLLLSREHRSSVRFYSRATWAEPSRSQAASLL